MRRPGHHELRGRNLCPDDPGGIQQPRQDGAHLVPAAARKQRHERAASPQPQVAQHIGPGAWRRNHVEERVPDPLHGDPCLAVESLLERENDQDLVRDDPHGLHASWPPGPELRADVVHDGDPELPERACQPEVEVRKVDRDEDVGPFLSRARDKAAIDAVGARQHTGSLDQPGHRQPAEIGCQACAGSPEPITAESCDGHTWLLEAELRRKRRRIQIAGRLAAGDHHAHGGRSGQSGLAKSAASSGTLYSNCRMTRVIGGSVG